MPKPLFGRLNTTKSILYLGQFGALALMVTLLIFNITLMDSARTRINTIVFDHYEKIELIIDMRTAARERTVSLQKMLILGDPISVSDELFDFTNFASNFLAAQEALSQLNLSESEHELLNEYIVFVKHNGTLQKNIVDLILEGNYEQAREMLLNQAMPMQDTVFDKMSKIIEIQKAATRNALSEGEAEYTHAINLITIAGSLTVLIVIFIVYSITKHISRSEKIIYTEKERAHTTLYSIGDAVITTDTTGIIEQINIAGEKMLGTDQESCVGKKLEDLVKLYIEDSPETHQKPIYEALVQNQTITSSGEMILASNKGTKYSVEYTASPIYNTNRETTGAVLVIKDVSENRHLMNELAYHARHDFLTGLVNRRENETLLKNLLSEYTRYDQDHAYLAFIDLDQFKIINDTCGHTAGDELLKQVAACLKKNVRDSDHVTRLGGDEFTVILKRCALDEAVFIMERIRNAIQTLNFCWENKCFNTSTSIGMVPIKSSVGNTQDLMSAADTACLVAKEEGRNRVHVYTEKDDKISRRQNEMQWVHRIKDAIADDRFEMFFQQIKPLGKNENRCHGEILLRLKAEDGKLIPPYSFIPSAERYHLMPEIDRHVISKTFALLNQFHKNPKVKNGIFSINLSAQTLCDDDFLNFISRQFSNLKLLPHNICFEITETAVMSNMSKAIIIIEALKERGCKFSLDDFGSGLSSFGYLKNLPVNHLKIDGSFVKNINNNRLDYVMVSAMNQIATTLGIDTIAEFVEDKSIEETLTSLGINYGQGYGIHMPESFSNVLEQLDNKSSMQKYG